MNYTQVGNQLIEKIMEVKSSFYAPALDANEKKTDKFYKQLSKSNRRKERISCGRYGRLKCEGWRRGDTSKHSRKTWI